MRPFCGHGQCEQGACSAANCTSIYFWLDNYGLAAKGGGPGGVVAGGGSGCQTALLSVSMKNYSSLSKIQYTRSVCAVRVCAVSVYVVSVCGASVPPMCVCWVCVLSVCSGRVSCQRGSLVNFSG